MDSRENQTEEEVLKRFSNKTLVQLGIVAGLLFGAGFLFGKFSTSTAPKATPSEADDLDKRQADYEKTQEKLKLSYYKDLSKEPRREAFDKAPKKEESQAPAATPTATEIPAPESDQVPPSAPPPKMPEEKPSSDRMAKALEKALGKETPDLVANSAKTQLPNRTGSPFAVQVASLPDRKVAEELANKLNLKGYDTRLVQADIPGRGTVYRVRIHGYSTRQEADEARSAIVKQERLDAITVAQ